MPTVAVSTLAEDSIAFPYGCHFILKIDTILMESQYADALKNDVKAGSFPGVPADYGYHDSKNFWYRPFKGFRPVYEPIATSNNADVDRVMYCAERLDTKVQFTKESCERYVQIPRPFRKAALLQVAQIA